MMHSPSLSAIVHNPWQEVILDALGNVIIKKMIVFVKTLTSELISKTYQLLATYFYISLPVLNEAQGKIAKDC
jgi:hypothetical protein